MLPRITKIAENEIEPNSLTVTIVNTKSILITPESVCYRKKGALGFWGSKHTAKFDFAISPNRENFLQHRT